MVSFPSRSIIMATKVKSEPISRLNGDVKVAEKAAESPRKIDISFELREILVKVVGESPLIVNRFKEKSIRQMADKQAGAASPGREKKNPKEDYEGSMYRLPDGGYAFPCSAFGKAAVTACVSLGKSVISQTQARQAIRVMGDYVKIEGTPTMREDVVKVGKFPNKVADLRYRAEFKRWSCVLLIKYNARVLTKEQIVNLLSLAGFAVGVGEWRPEKSGQFGMFKIEKVESA
jgi:hypothetical protein